MKFQGRKRPFSPALPAACLATGLLAACATSNRAPGTQPDGYPNLNIPIPAAASQLTNRERDEYVQALSEDLELPNEVPDPSADELEQLRRLGRLHAEERLRSIEVSEME